MFDTMKLAKEDSEVDCMFVRGQNCKHLKPFYLEKKLKLMLEETKY